MRKRRIESLSDLRTCARPFLYAGQYLCPKGKFRTSCSFFTAILFSPQVSKSTQSIALSLAVCPVAYFTAILVFFKIYCYGRSIWWIMSWVNCKGSILEDALRIDYFLWRWLASERWRGWLQVVWIAFSAKLIHGLRLVGNSDNPL